MKKFHPNRNGYIRVLLLASLALPTIIILLIKGNVSENLILVALTFIPFIFFLWIYIGTSYIVQDGKLLYRSAFISGQVDIAKIREIIKGKTSLVGIKPATAANGLLIKFNTHNEIYISPDDNDALIEALREINDKIIVTV